MPAITRRCCSASVPMVATIGLLATLLNVGIAEAVAEPPAGQPPAAVEGWGMWQPLVTAPHLVLRPHRQPRVLDPAPEEFHGRPEEFRGREEQHHHVRGEHLHPEHVQGPRAAVPAAATVHRRKLPYSYGYFGAQEKRHWSRHYGHQRDRIEWVLR